MKTQQITEEDIAERDEYCSRKRLKEIIKSGKTFEEIMKEDVIMFFSHELGMVPLAWQFKVLKVYMQGSRRIVACTSRQIGKSILAAGVELWRVKYNKGLDDRDIFTNRKKYTAECIISRGDEQAKKLLREIKQMLYAGDSFMSNEYLDKKGKAVFGKNHFTKELSKQRDGNNLTTITFKKGKYGALAGSFIKSLPPTDVILGETFTGGIIDEAARVEDLIVQENFLPTLKSFGKFMMVISTPLNPDGYFYKRVDPDELGTGEGWDRFMFDIDAIKLELPQQWDDVQEEIKEMLRDGKNNEVMRNYYCSFTSSDELYFPSDKIEKVFRDDIVKVDEMRGVPVCMGVDFGGYVKSHTVITLATYPKEGNPSHRIACWRYPVKKDFNMIQDIERNILPHFQVIDIVVDLCPASTITVGAMKDKGWNIIEFGFNRSTKPDFMNRFRKLLSHEMALTYHDPSLKEEFANYTDDLKPAKGCTDDCIDSWMMACIPFMDTEVKFDVFTIGGKQVFKEGQEEESKALAALNSHKTMEAQKHEMAGLSRII